MTTQKYNLDANGGLTINQDDLQYFINIETQINNINGWSVEKMNIKEEYLLVKDKLLKTFINSQNEQQYSNIYYTFSVSDALKTICQAISYKRESLFVYPNQHPHIQKITTNACFQSNYPKKTCLINLLTSQTNEDQSEQIKDAEQKGYLYTMVDASQALGRLKLKDYIDMIDCLIISPRKVGGMSNLCFIFTTKQFDEKYDLQKQFLPESKFISVMLASAKPVIDAFPANDYNKEANKLQQQNLIQQLSQYEYIKPLPLSENVPQTHTALLIELDGKLCPRLFQQELAKHGIDVGFETACQSDTSNKIRLSWRQIYPEIDITQEIQEAIEVCENDSLQNENLQPEDEQQGQTLTGRGYKLKLQQDKQYDPKQGARNLSMFNKRLFYLRGHWVPLNTDDNEAVRYRIPPKYAVMFQNFVLQQRQDYYLYIPELKEEFKEWLERKKAENYELEQHAQKQAQQQDSDKKQNHTEKQAQQQQHTKEQELEETPLEAFEYLYRVAKHIYLTPSPDDHPDNVLSLEDFKFNESDSRYLHLPDDFIQLFQNVKPSKDDGILYPMTYNKYKKCLKEEIDLTTEYVNNPASEFVMKLKLPIQEHFINSANSYKHVIRKSLVYEQNKTHLTIEQRLESVNPKYVQVIQPARSYVNDTAMEFMHQVVKNNDKAKIVMIIHNPTIDQQEEIFKHGFEEVRSKILSYQNWYQQWYFDDNIYTYTRNIRIPK